MKGAKEQDDPAPLSGLDQPELEDESLVHLLGAQALHLYRTGVEISSVFIQTLYYCFRGRPDFNAVVRQMFEIGNRSVVFLTVVMGFIGMILVLQGGLQVKRVLPEFSMVGPTYLELLIRDLAASIGALML